MLGEKFEIWLANSIFDAIRFTVGIHVINLGYLGDGLSYFSEYSYSDIEESNQILVEFDKAIVIPDYKNE